MLLFSYIIYNKHVGFSKCFYFYISQNFEKVLTQNRPFTPPLPSCSLLRTFIKRKPNTVIT